MIASFKEMLILVFKSCKQFNTAINILFMTNRHTHILTITIIDNQG